MSKQPMGRSGWMSEAGATGAMPDAVVCSSPGGSHTELVWITTINDESLPHPGDQRDWTTRLGDPVTRIIAVDGDYVWAEYEHPMGWTDRDVLRADSLRERKEPEHEEWCPVKDHTTRWPKCSCERRSGEDRREGERRGTPNFAPQWARGRRSGEDRRQS